ncbi:glycosyltransferase family 2 protein [Actinoplanes sp. NPDC051343]|uniref:glycosyltransferase family 2 protein n=1 Tax=Actinoplanes sp. NPDC051343 TaxID=3363906 RepID=UPI00379C2914
MHAEPPVFVMPYFHESRESARYLRRALDGLLAQTDPHWHLVIIDDGSPPRDAVAAVHELRGADQGRITVIERPVNQGQAVCRNVGVAWASGRRAPFILFHDADDISHEQRLEVTRETFSSRPHVGFVYSGLQVIDEDDLPVGIDRLTPSVSEIIRSHAKPVEGPNAWIAIGTESGYTTLTSTVSVRTDVAVAHPFPPVRGAEDGHTWLRMSAGGAHFAYLDGIPGRYRVPQASVGSSDRTRIGSSYYLIKAIVDRDGFVSALRLALEAGTVDALDAAALHQRFLHRLASTLQAEGRHALAQDVLADRIPAIDAVLQPLSMTTGPS